MPIVEYEGRSVHFLGEYGGSYTCISEGRFYELPLLEEIRSRSLSGIYLDIGTNIGNHAMFFALFCACSRVIGFEPVAHWRRRALANLEANDCLDKVEVRDHGLYSEPTTLDFAPYGTVHKLDCTTLDIALPDIANVTLVKMDIEGSEPAAMLGGIEFFRRNRPVIFAEVINDPDELLGAAEAIGYRHSGFVIGRTPMYELVPR